MNNDKDFEDIMGKVKREGRANCFEFMKPKIIDCVKDERLILSFPVLEQYLNPAKSMQGGFITAAFDNAFGVLCYCSVECAKIATIDISTSYQRPIFSDDELIVKVYIKLKGKTIVHMTGEAYNKENKLIATANTNIMIIN